MSQYYIIMLEPITIKDIAIITFYKENPNLDIVTINRIFIDILKKLSSNLSSTINNSISSQILSTVNDIKGELYKFNSDITNRLHETKKEYMNDIRMLFTNTELSNQEKINKLIDKSNDTLMTKTTLLINEVIPKSQEKNYIQVEQCIKTFFEKITEDTTRLLKLHTDNNKTNNDSNKSNEIIDKIEKNFNNMVVVIQQPLFNAIHASETRTQQNIQTINENINLQKQIQDTLSAELNVFLNKYKTNSSVKGSVSETELYHILQSLLPSDEIIRCSKEVAYCDIRVNRRDRKLPTILFENKDYSVSVNTEEIEKFERDLKIRKCHGIFISQNSPITYKDNFHIDIINNLIHLYIPNANYDREKIKLAINIVDSLSEKINNINGENEKIYLTIEEVEDLKEEYILFANKKSEMIDTIKFMTKQLIEKMEDIQIPSIKKIAAYSSDNKNVGIVCNICGKFTGKNKASLSAHMKACKVSKTATSSTTASTTSLSSTN